MNLVILKPLDVDLVIIFTVFIFVFHSEKGAGIFAFGQGLVTDMLSGGMLGLFTSIYFIVFLGINFATRPLDMLSYGGQFLIVSTAVILKEAVMVFILRIFSLEISLSAENVLSFIISAILSGLIAPFVFYLMNHFWDFFSGENSEV